MLYFEEGKEKLYVHLLKLGKLIYCWLGHLFFFQKQKDIPCFNKFQAFLKVGTSEGYTIYCFNFPDWTTVTEFNNSYF